MFEHHEPPPDGVPVWLPVPSAGSSIEQAAKVSVKVMFWRVTRTAEPLRLAPGSSGTRREAMLDGVICAYLSVRMLSVAPRARFVACWRARFLPVVVTP